MGLNVLDYLLILFVIVGTLLGMIRGFFRVLIGLVSLYLGLVVALLFYRPLGAFFKELLSALSVPASQGLAFGLILVLFVNGLALVTRLLSTPAEERKRKDLKDVQDIIQEDEKRKRADPLSQLGGLLLGFVLTLIWISLIMGVIQFILRASGGMGGGFRALINGSALVPMFNLVLFFFYRAVSFWMPGDSPPGIFSRLFQP